MTNKKSFKFNTFLTLISVAITIFLVVVGSYIQEGYNISVGDVSPRDFKATRQVEDRVTTDRLREEAKDTVVTVYKQDPMVEVQIKEQLNTFFNDALNLRTINENTYYENTEETLPYEEVQQNTILNFIQNSEALVTLSEAQINYIINMDNSLFNQLQSNVYVAFERLMQNGVRENESDAVSLEIVSYFETLEVPQEMSHLGYTILNNYIQPNILVDEEATERLREERAAEVEPVIFLQNQKIVNEGEIITEEIYYVLEELGFIDIGYSANFVPIIGSTIIIAIVFGIAIIYIYLFNDKLYNNKKHILLLFTLYITLIIVTRVLVNIAYVFVPILMFVMLVGMLLDYKLALVLNILVTIITLLIFKGDLDYMLYFLITGTIMAIITKYGLERNKVIIFSLIISVFSTIVAVSIDLFLNRAIGSDIVITAIYAFLSGFFSVVICMGTLPIWETIFGVITPVKLLDLTNPDNELLRRLSIEAPGTYHHSIIVANLSEAAAYDIKADTVVARVSAYFHDIGKLKYPHYFVENQIGENPHDKLDPYSSFEIIKSHIDYGLELATEKKLPAVIKDIIEQHHGTTKVKFFYYKAKKENPDIEVKEDDFRYNGPTPNSKEAAIVMMADTVEAAVRSMVSQTKSSNEIEEFIRILIKDKLDEGQFINSELTIKDLYTIQKSFVRVFNGMYHERIPYPKEVQGSKEINKED